MIDNLRYLYNHNDSNTINNTGNTITTITSLFLKCFTVKIKLQCPLLNEIPQIEGGNSIRLKKECTAHVSVSNPFTQMLKGAVLAVEGFGLMQGKHEAR